MTYESSGVMSMGSKSSFTFVIAHALNAVKPVVQRNIATTPRGVVMAFTYFSHEALVADDGDAGDCCDTDSVNSISEADSSGPTPLDSSSSSALRAAARSSRTNTATKKVTWTKYTGVYTKICNVNKCFISQT